MYLTFALEDVFSLLQLCWLLMERTVYKKSKCSIWLTVFTLSFVFFFCLVQVFSGGLLFILLVWFLGLFFLFTFCPSAGGKWVTVDQSISKKSEKIRSFQTQNQILGVKAKNQCKRCLTVMRISSFFFLTCIYVS